MNEVILRSSVSDSLMRSTLWRGTILALLGAFLLLGAGIFMHPKTLAIWGFPLFLLGIGLITFGMVPYRRLKQLEMHPYNLTIDEHWLHLSLQRKPLLSIPWKTIQEIKWIEKRWKYGIGIVLKETMDQDVIVYAKRLGPFKHRDYDFFLPYFSKRSCNALQENIRDFRD